jgi:S-adenosylmethionine:diacylglycerol 3-amino-3-carboxypropyl transferase
MHELAQTPWLDGALRASPQRLVFGQTYEDPQIELRAIPPRSRVLCIAGAGFTARVLAGAGHRVTAVDISAAQLDYARALNRDSLPRAGLAERALGVGRHVAALCGWTHRKLDAFLSLSQCGEQVEYWDRELDTPAWRAMFDTFLGPRLLRSCYRGPFVALLPHDFGPCVRQRLRRGWALHLNRSNPYAAFLLLGRPIECARTPGLPIRWVCADVAEFLELCPPGSFDAFALSNIGDGASTAYRQRLGAAVERAAAPEATVIWRSFSEPRSCVATNTAAVDRSLVWGVVSVRRVNALRSGGELCCIG